MVWVFLESLPFKAFFTHQGLFGVACPTCGCCTIKILAKTPVVFAIFENINSKIL